MRNKRNGRWKTCDGCGKQTKKIRLFKGKFYCFQCYQKNITQIYVLGQNLIFGEPLSEKLVVGFNLTLTQKTKLDERLRFINPSRKINLGVANYIRTLILSDLEGWEIIKKLDKEYEEFIKTINELKNE